MKILGTTIQGAYPQKDIFLVIAASDSFTEKSTGREFARGEFSRTLCSVVNGDLVIPDIDGIPATNDADISYLTYSINIYLKNNHRALPFIFDDGGDNLRLPSTPSGQITWSEIRTNSQARCVPGVFRPNFLDSEQQFNTFLQQSQFQQYLEQVSFTDAIAAVKTELNAKDALTLASARSYTDSNIQQVAGTGITGEAIPSTDPPDTGFYRYSTTTPGTYINFPDSGGIPLSVSTADFTGKICELWGTNNVWKKVVVIAGRDGAGFTDLYTNNYGLVSAEIDLDNRISRGTKANGRPFDINNPGTPVEVGGGGIGQATYNLILMGGQSNSLGAATTEVLSTVQPYNNKMFAAGVRTTSFAGMRSLAPLVEIAEGSLEGETPFSGFANRTSSEYLAEGKTFDAVCHTHGGSGLALADIRNGTAFYALGMLGIESAVSLAFNDDRRLLVPVMLWLHGEQDAGNSIPTGTTAYDTELLDLIVNHYNPDIKTRTGQTVDIPFIIIQLSTAGSATAVHFAQLNAHELQPTRVFIFPSYIFPRTDTVHYSVISRRWIGEYFSKIFRWYMKGQDTAPLKPVALSRTGAVITVDFHVPVAPLVLDVTTFAEVTPAGGRYGFEFADDSGAAPAITNVAITSPTQIQVTLAAVPTGANKKLSYGRTITKGNLRDSDPAASLYGNTLYNWCVIFNKAVN